jgi:hypothetical protein
MQHGDLDKTKVLKTQRDSMSDVRKPNSKCAEIYHTGQTSIEHRSDRLDLSKSKFGPLDMSGSFTDFQSRLPDMSGIGLDKSGKQNDCWNLSSTRQVRP